MVGDLLVARSDLVAHPVSFDRCPQIDMVALSMTFHTQVVGNNAQPQAMYIERVPGLTEVILSGFEFGPSGV